jgi:hypothetical protein
MVTQDRLILLSYYINFTHRRSYHDSKFLRALLYKLQTFWVCENKYNGVPTDIFLLEDQI